jgi:KDO2-lipid IV(A) lauroyltransferase
MNPWRELFEEKLLRFIAWILRRFPHRLSLWTGRCLGSFVYRLGVRTDVALSNLSRAFPEKEPKEIEVMAHSCYRHFGAVLSEFARLPMLNKQNVDRYVRFINPEILDKCLQEGRGGIVVSGHFGNWELMGAAVAIKRYPVSYVVTTQRNKRVEKLMDRIREGVGVQIIKRRQAIKGVIKALRENRLVAILSDQDTHEAGVFVPFFGRPASTPKGAAMFSLRTGAPVVFAESYRNDDGKLVVHLERLGREDLPEDHDEAILELTKRYTFRLEQAIRRHPEQWFWMHRRWKTKPPDQQ